MYDKYKVNVPSGISGEWSVEQFEVTKNEAELEKVRALFNGGRGVPVGKYTALKRNNQIVMSDTPDEIRDHFSIIWAAKGSVLINGLGIGVVLQACLNKDSVTHVTVIEQSKDVISLIGDYYKNIYSDRLTIIHDDAFAYKPPKNIKYGAVWHDIWDNICADNLPEMHRLHRKYGRRTEWQGSWARAICERAAKTYF